jgi:ribonuclease HI
LSRLELAERLAAGGYGLTAVELARLLEVPIGSLEGKVDPWAWRDWLVRPLGDGRWRLERGTGGLARQQ